MCIVLVSVLGRMLDVMWVRLVNVGSVCFWMVLFRIFYWLFSFEIFFLKVLSVFVLVLNRVILVFSFEISVGVNERVLIVVFLMVCLSDSMSGIVCFVYSEIVCMVVVIVVRGGVVFVILLRLIVMLLIVDLN